MRRAAVALFVLVAGAAPATAQQRAVVWDVRSSAAVDLWYHGLALAGYDGPGPLAWYSAAYARDVRADTLRRGLRTRLDRDGAALRAAFLRDSTFESLHFLPLYSAGERPEPLLDLVRAVAGGDLETGQGVPAKPGADADVVAALRRAFSSASQRRVLRQFADALEDEWRLYLRPARVRDAAASEARIAAARTAWQRDVEPLIRDHAGAQHVRGATIFVSPAVGAEGRFLRWGDGAIIVVQAPRRDTLGQAIALSVVRELCFPAVRPAMDAVAGTTSRLAATDAASRAATRCGAGLLAARPDLLRAFQDLFHEALITRR